MAMNWPFEENALENQLSSYLPTYDRHCFFFGDAKLDIFSFLRNLSFYASVFIDQKNVK